MAVRRTLSNVAVVGSLAMLHGCEQALNDASPAEHEQDVLAWQTDRAAGLIRPDGWLSLVGLFWFKPGEQTFGSAEAAAIRLDDTRLPDTIGTFTMDGGRVMFAPAIDVPVLHEGVRLRGPLALAPDTSGEPTVLSFDSLIYGLPLRCKRVFAFGFRIGLQPIYPASRCVRRRGP